MVSETGKPNPLFSMVSGNKCKKALPNKVPADKLIRNNNIFFRNLSLNDNENTPTKDTSETIITLKIVYKIVVMILL